MKNFLSIFVLCVAALLSACATKVNLDDAAISDAKGTPVVPENESANKDNSAVKQVNLTENQTPQAGPKDVAQIVYFDFDSFIIKPEFQSVIDGHAKHLTRNKGARVFIEGHTDEVGGREYNLALGQKRAEAVRRALSLLGVPEAQVEAVSFGKEKPADTGGSEESMAKNRRAQFSYR